MRKKLTDVKEGKPSHAVAAVAQSMAGVEAALEDATARKATSLDFGAKLLEILPNGLDTAQRVRDLLARTQQVNMEHASGSALAVPGDSGPGAAASAGRSVGQEVARKSDVGPTTEKGEGEEDLV